MEVVKIDLDMYHVTDSDINAVVKWGGSKHLYETTIKGKGAKIFRSQILVEVSLFINKGKY